MVLGKIAVGYDKECAYNRKTAYVENINKVTVSASKFKEFMVRDECVITPDTEYPTDWNSHMILHANFADNDPDPSIDHTRENYDSGNYKYNIENTKAILIKRRPVGTQEWMTIYQKDIIEPSDFTFSFFDNYAASMLTYEYALVPIRKDTGAEGRYTYSYVDSKFDGCYIVGRDKMFRMFVDLKMDRSMNAPRAFITSLNKKYPTTVKTSKAKYIKGSASASVIDFDCDNCQLDEKDAWKYRNDFLDFLYDGTAKFMKTADGRFNYIIEIEDGASESASENWNLPTTSFNFVQIGSAESTEDMVKAGLLDMSREWWTI